MYIYTHIYKIYLLKIFRFLYRASSASDKASVKKVNIFNECFQKNFSYVIHY